MENYGNLGGLAGEVGGKKGKGREVRSEKWMWKMRLPVEKSGFLPGLPYERHVAVEVVVEVEIDCRVQESHQGRHIDRW